MSSTFHYGDTEAEQKKHLLLKSIAPLGSASVFTYDAFGNPLTSQVQNADANPSYFIRGETSYTNDGNYVTEQKDARGKIVRTETDLQRGTTTSVTDAKGQTVTYEYDNLRRIVKTSANVGAEAGIATVHNEYTYDAKRGNLVEIRHNTDGNAANDVVYSFEQDALGRQTAVKVGNQTLSQSQYQNDPTKPNFGTLTATTYGNGAKVSSRYDDFNRVTGVVYGEETAPRYEYDYNAKGQVARVRDNLLNRTTQSEYDLANRPVRVKTSEDAKHVYTGQVAYDNVYGNLSEFTEKVGENRQEYGTKFGYDDENRPTSLTYSIGATTIGQSTTTIDKLNRTTFSAVKLGSKTFTSEYHFAAGGYGTGSVTNLVSSITQPGCNCGYGYDDNGNIASATLNGKWTGYTYDELGQLIQVNDHSDTRSGENGTTWKYTYDLGGNILKKERFAYADTTTPLETVTYEYGDANWRDKLTAVNGSTIRYDAIGNPLNDGTWTYTWQNGRQLQKMQKSGVTAEFVYNADGLRVQKTVNGVVTDYTLHGKNVVHMTKGNDELHFFYDAQNRPAVVVYNGTAYAYVKSLQGDIVAILDENGNTVVSYGYDAWGALLWCTGELAETLGKVQPFRYRGYVFDEETGLYYLRSRYYNPQWGRFANADSIITSNLFAYCHNEPVQFADFNGMLEQCGNKFSYKMFSEGAGVGSSGSGGGGGILLLITEVIPDALSYIGRKFTDAVIGFTMLFAGEAAYIGDLCVPQPNPTPFSQSTPEPTPSPQAYFPANPEEFQPHLLVLHMYTPTVWKWEIPGTKTAIFEWDADSKYGDHYHVMTPSMKNSHSEGTHYYAGYPVPEPWNTLFFYSNSEAPWDKLD